MAKKPIFVATHPRACSTAFERVFMTRHEDLKCIHEPFGDAFYYGPERLSERFEKDEQRRQESGFSEISFQSVLDRLDRDSEEGKRLFVKDMMQYLVPPDQKPPSIAPSLSRTKRGVGTSGTTNGELGKENEATPNGIKPDGPELSNSPYPYGTESEPNNPTVVPEEILRKFHFTFLIRHPSKSIPSYYRCTVPPLEEITGWNYFMPNEAGYDELRRVFDYLRSAGQVGPRIAGGDNELMDGQKGEEIEICVVDADDLLDNPAGIIQAYCKSVGLDFDPDMLVWDTEEDHEQAVNAFEKWKGFHEDAIDSSDLRPRSHHHRPKTPVKEDHTWAEKYGPEAAETIRDTVNSNIEDYEYLKQFALKVPSPN